MSKPDGEILSLSYLLELDLFNEEVGVYYQRDEKCFEDKNAEIVGTILRNEKIETTKNRLKVLKD